MPEARRTQVNLDRLRTLISEADGLSAQTYESWVERATIALRRATGSTASPEYQRFEDITFRQTSYFGVDYSHAALKNGVRSAKAILVAVAEDVELHLQESAAPGPSIGGLHSWVADAASGLWNDGHRREAVQNAAGAVEQRLKLKLDVHSGGAASIVITAFSSKGPVAGSPRLHFADVGPKGSEQWINAHDGAGAFGRGCFMRIRNLYVHNGGASEQEDLEALAALSLLARWIEVAGVVRLDA